MDLSRIPIGENPPHEVNVIIEIPQGGAPVKYEVDKVSGAMFVDRFLHTAMFYPANYGFVPHTLSEDGDPIDCMVIAPTPVATGAVVRARPIGALLMEDEKASMRRSWPCPSTNFIHSTSGLQAIATCRKSLSSRSAISLSIVRTSKRANG